MKLRKVVMAIVLIAALVAQFMFIQFSNYSLAAGETPTVGIQLKPNMSEAHREEEFDVIARINQITNAGKGIVVVGATLNYDTAKLELVSIKGAGTEEDGWKISRNPSNGKFVLDHDGYVNSAQDILNIKFKVKADAVESTETVPSTARIELTNITVSGGNGIINVADINTSVKVVKTQELEKNITSTKYEINKNDQDISKIEPQTTITQFLGNVKTENVAANEIVFTDKNGTVINANTTVLRTGMILKIADKFTFTLIVKGDLDGEANDKGEVVTEADLAKVKLHYIGHTVITDKTMLKAANYDSDAKREISVNDIAMMKLQILGLLNETK